MNCQCVVVGVDKFYEERTNVHDEEKSGRPSIITNELIQSVHEFMNKDRCMT